jgi:hypothetical protein
MTRGVTRCVPLAKHYSGDQTKKDEVGVGGGGMLHVKVKWECLQICNGNISREGTILKPLRSRGNSTQGRTQRGRATGLQPHPFPNKNTKEHKFCRHDIKTFTWFSFSRHQPLKSVDYQSITIFKIKKLRISQRKFKRKSKGHCDLN